jgi:undecaprenyl diphosphate synthase
LSDKRKKAGSTLDKAKLPTHVAIIMDGNGRWAAKYGLPRVMGHRRAIESIRDVLETADELGIKYVTLYCFSVENFTRPKDEVRALFDLFGEVVRTEVATLHKRGVQIRVSGEMSLLPAGLRRKFERACTLTKNNGGLVLNLAVAYSGRAEIVAAVRKVGMDAAAGRLEPRDVTEKHVAARLYQPDIPDPDLLIRTGAESRVSNFLLWQIAYSELYFTRLLWPEFGRKEFIAALEDFARRERRFGGIG